MPRLDCPRVSAETLNPEPGRLSQRGLGLPGSPDPGLEAAFTGPLISSRGCAAVSKCHEELGRPSVSRQQRPKQPISHWLNLLIKSPVVRLRESCQMLQINNALSSEEMCSIPVCGIRDVRGLKRHLSQLHAWSLFTQCFPRWKDFGGC